MAKPGPRPLPTQCKVDSCEKQAVRCGWCNAHYRKYLKYGDPTKGKHRTTCTVEGCTNRHQAHGFCAKHLARLQRHGSPYIKTTSKLATCELCGITFPYPSRTKYVRFCCREHANKWHYEKAKRKRIIGKCKRCGCEIKTYAFYDKKYCDSCRWIAVTEARTRTVKCRICGEHMTTANPHNDICKTCSYEKRIKKTIKRNNRRKAMRRGALGPTHTEQEWETLLASYNGMCAYCGTKPSEHRDHVLPISRGGSDAITNILPACKMCNLRKGARTLEEWQAVSKV